MFYLVRNEPETSEALSRWAEHSINLLRETGDRSLAETLIYFARRHDYFRDAIMRDVLKLVPGDEVLQAALDRVTVPESK
jgi:hypothetical protein